MPRRQYTLTERLNAIEEAIFSMDPAKFQDRVVRDAFTFFDRAEVAFHLLRRVERKFDLALMIELEPAKSALNWDEIRTMSLQACKLKLYERPVLGPVFPKSTLKVVERIVKWVESGGNADDAPAELKGAATRSVADLLCYLADRHRGLSSKFRTSLPRTFFCERVHRRGYTARMKEALGLFAGVVEAA